MSVLHHHFLVDVLSCPFFLWLLSLRHIYPFSVVCHITIAISSCFPFFLCQIFCSVCSLPCISYVLHVTRLACHTSHFLSALHFKSHTFLSYLTCFLYVRLAVYVMFTPCTFCLALFLPHACAASLMYLLYSFLQILCNSALLCILSLNFEHLHMHRLSLSLTFAFLLVLPLSCASSFCEALSLSLHIKVFLSPVHILFCFYLFFPGHFYVSLVQFSFFISCHACCLIPLSCVLLSCLLPLNLCLCLPFPSLFPSFLLS